MTKKKSDCFFYLLFLHPYPSSRKAAAAQVCMELLQARDVIDLRARSCQPLRCTWTWLHSTFPVSLWNVVLFVYPFLSPALILLLSLPLFIDFDSNICIFVLSTFFRCFFLFFFPSFFFPSFWPGAVVRPIAGRTWSGHDSHAAREKRLPLRCCNPCV